ncbi:MAG: hypothetical protein R3F49_01085 [Planctomycetota bacterium]
MSTYVHDDPSRAAAGTRSGLLAGSAAGSAAGRPAWLAAGALGCMLLGTLLQPAGALQGTGGQTAPPQSQTQPMLSNGGGASDSNNRMIAVTGVDLTGQSVLYLVDTEGMQLACYQATGGAGGTQGLRLVGARRIDLDLMLDGFNDKTEDSSGRPLRYRELEKQFQDKGLLDPAAGGGNR